MLLRHLDGITKRVFMTEEGNVSPENILKSIDKDTKMVYICNPNNPTGMFIDPEKIDYISENTKAFLVIDESAIEFTGHSGININKKIKDNVIVVRSLSKAYGIADLRVGYMICSEHFKKIYKENITINEVPGISCLYARKVILSNQYKRNIRKIIKERERIEKRLSKTGLEFYKSCSNILFSKSKLNTNIKQRFEQQGVSAMFVNDEYGRQHFRIAIQDRKTNDKFIKKIESILEE